MEFIGLSRRGLMTGLAVLGGLPGLARAAAASSPVVETAGGRVQGFLNASGVASYLGIPYGASTGGANRFMPPKPAASWAGVRETVAYGPSAPQVTTDGPQLPDAPAGPAMNEDCLVLNVWTPSPQRGSGRAVMVWLHGGGFSTGSGSGAATNGANLAAIGDVVVVSINHRLNAFGYSYLGRIGGADFADSGNVGQLDIIQALQWVRDNIEAFGGDPSRVTIFGNSGGGSKVETIMAMPSGKGLFHRAIAQSGNGYLMAEADLQDQAARALMTALGLARGDVRALQAVPQAALLKAYNDVSGAVRGPRFSRTFSPTVDGRSLPSHPFAKGAPAVSAGIPAIIGYNHHEVLWFRRDLKDMSFEEALSDLRGTVGDAADAAVAAYRAARPDLSAREILILVSSDYQFGAFQRQIAATRADAGGAPTYFYRFDWETNVGRLRAAHTMEIPFVFSTLQARRAIVGTTPGQEALAQKMTVMWANFAKTGRAAAEGWPGWRPYNTASRPTMLLNNTIEMVNDPDRPLRIASDRVMGLWPVA